MRRWMTNNNTDLAFKVHVKYRDLKRVKGKVWISNKYNLIPYECGVNYVWTIDQWNALMKNPCLVTIPMERTSESNNKRK